MKHSPPERAIVDRVREDLLTGRHFALRVMSHRSADFMRSRAPIGHATWAHAVATLARMAAQSQPLASIAQSVVIAVPLYGTPPQVAAAIFDAGHGALAAGYHDVIAATGPEAGRPSLYRRSFTLRERIEVAYWLQEATAPCLDTVPTIGWVLPILASEVGFDPSPSQFPTVLRSG